jgi:signal peptidase I
MCHAFLHVELIMIVLAFICDIIPVANAVYKRHKMNNKRDKLTNFLFPRITRRFAVRFLMVAVAAYIFFGQICLPMRISGPSMEPTYHNGKLTFCWRLKYLFRKPERGDVVAVRLAGPSIMFLKRIVALEGETVEFKNGKLVINGKVLSEPYVRYPCSWNKPPTKVGKNCVYVIGDNRNVAIDLHRFGEIETKRITGSPIW